MLPARRYWARFLLYLALGFLAGLVVGLVIQSWTATPGYGVFGAASGLVLGVFLFMLRPDT